MAAASPVFASTYIVTIAGLGGEPDYEQRFAALATDMDKLLRADGQTDRVVETLKGPDATRVKLEATLNKIAGKDFCKGPSDGQKTIGMFWGGEGKCTPYSACCHA